jgi:hypothetical protein
MKDAQPAGTYDQDAKRLISDLSFEIPYDSPEDAAGIRKWWRFVARKSEIKIETFDFKQMGLIIVIRKTPLPGDNQLRETMFKEAARMLGEEIDRATTTDAT